jgi:hypothetical protein
VSAEDEAARRVAELDSSPSTQRRGAVADAKGFADFYSTLREAGITEDQAFTLTHEWSGADSLGRGGRGR